MRLNGILLLLLLAMVADAGTPYQAMIHYPDLPTGAMPQALVADADGNLFIIANIVNSSGRPQIHVQKTDSHGSALASLEFGGSTTGAGLSDTIAGAAIDPKGNLVIAGSTSAPDFPLVSPLTAKTGKSAAFIVKIDSQLKNILFSTKLGGAQGGTTASALSLDQAGNIYLTGTTSDADFPVTPGAFQSEPPLHNQSGNAVYAYVTEVSSDFKSIVFSTYFGDSAAVCTAPANVPNLCTTAFGRTYTSALTLDATGNVIIAGSTTANHLPVTPGVLGPNCGDCADFPQANAGFVAKLSAGGSKLLWATHVPVVKATPFLAYISIETMALDRTGNIIAGGMASAGFSVTDGAVQTVFPEPTTFQDFAGFVIKLSPSAERLVFATYFGGVDSIGTVFGLKGVVVDPQGAVWVTGVSPVEDLPVSEGTPILGESYLAALSPDGSALANLFTAPKGVVGQAIVVSPDGTVTAMGSDRTLLTVSPGQGPSLVGIGNSAGSSVSNAVAPYELISLYGLGLGPQTTVEAQMAGGLITTSLGGVQVLFDGIPAPILFVGPTQINVVVPSSVYQRDTTALQIVTPLGILKGPAMLTRPSQPGIFPVWSSLSIAPLAVARNEDGSLNSAANPAALGSDVTVWASGAGMSSAPQPDGTILRFAAGVPTLPVSVFSFPLLSLVFLGESLPGPLSLEVLYAADAAGMVAGVTEIRFRLPAQVDLVDLRNVVFAVRVGDASSDPFSIYLKCAVAL